MINLVAACHQVHVVGNNQGLSDELELRYAQSDAEKAAKVLVDVAGFHPSAVRVLTKGRAKDLHPTPTVVCAT